jgi:hypothetical protein
VPALTDRHHRRTHQATAGKPCSRAPNVGKFVPFRGAAPESIATIASLGGDAVFDIALGESFVDGGEAADESEEEGSESGIAPDGESSGETGAVGGPRPSPNFVEPTNAAQLPPSDLPSGYSVRVMPPTDQYPDGYWVETNETGQFVDPSTGRPPSNVSRAVARSMTHVPLPPGG